MSVVKSCCLIALYVFVFLLFKYVFVFTVVSGSSMEDTLHDGDILFCSRLVKNPKQGDIVMIYANQLNENIVKRVIATGGDTIEIIDNKVYVNSKVLEESYIKEEMMTSDMSKTTLGEGQIFVMGDNRNNSLDSRRVEVGIVDVDSQVFGVSLVKMGTFGYIVAGIFVVFLVFVTDAILNLVDGKEEKAMKEVKEDAELLCVTDEKSGSNSARHERQQSQQDTGGNVPEVSKSGD
jgi:signal peptidase I